jgi:cell division protein FtsL
MILFFIKKVFFDAWDNLITIVLFNIGFSVIIAATSYIAFLFEAAGIAYFLTVIAGIFIFNIYSGAVSGYMSELLQYKSPEIKQFPLHLKKHLKSALVISGISIFQFAVLIVGFPFYFSIGGLPGLIGLVTLFWISVLWWIAVQYFFPVATQIEPGIKKQLKKSFILLLDNTLFSVFLGIYSIIVLSISIFTALLIPGISVILLAHQTALKLRLYKYDYLQENSENNRKNIPWSELLYDEKEKIGTRTLRGMIFPWKD